MLLPEDFHVRFSPLSGLFSVYTVYDEADNPVRVLRVKRAFQSATYLDERRHEPVFEYQRTLDIWREIIPNAHSFAVLGGAGFSVPRALASQQSNDRAFEIDTVEIDGAIVEAARQWFFLDEFESDPHFRVHVADAYQWLQSLDRSFDVIINDCFIGLHADVNALDVDVVQVIHDHLNDGGLYMSNVVPPEQSDDEEYLASYTERLEQVFSHTAVIPCFDEEFARASNYLVLGRDLPFPWEHN